MKGHSTWRNKRGSILYGVMILILCSSLLLHQYRLIQSHTYLLRGIYSLDVRMERFREDMDDVELELNLRFESFEAFKTQMNKNKKIQVLSFEITKDTMYNEYDILMLKVCDSVIQHTRWVRADDKEGKITLNVRGV